MTQSILKIMNHEKVLPKMSVTTNEWKHKHSEAIRKSPKWTDLKHEKGAYGRKQHKKIQH